MLIDQLQQVQRAMRWTDAELARRCGVKVRMLQAVRAGTARFGPRSLTAIAESFPGLRDDVLAYMESHRTYAERAVECERVGHDAVEWQTERKTFHICRRCGRTVEPAPASQEVAA